MPLRSHLRAALAALAALTLLATPALLPACVEEDKAACRDDGDCRGVRECRDGACVTPPDLLDSLGPSANPDAGSGAATP